MNNPSVMESRERQSVKKNDTQKPAESNETFFFQFKPEPIKFKVGF